MMKCGTRIRTFLLAAYVLLAGSASAAANDVVNIFLVQNSGWMEPFYVDPTSSFKPLVSEIVRRVRRPDEAVVISSFNQSIGTNHSPQMQYRGAVLDDITRAINSIDVAKKPGSSALTDTDFKESLVGAIREFSPGKPCILWVFTNNKNSPQNSPETVAKNSQFYSWLQSEEQINRIVAFPYKIAVKGKLYKASGAMIYGIAYGDEAGNRLTQMLDANLPFGEQPARLKPLNAEAITFVPQSVKAGKGYSVSLGADRRTLVLKFDGSAHPATAELTGSFLNDFNPYDIVSAKVGLAVDFKGGAQGVKADISPATLEKVDAGSLSDPMRVTIAIPPLPSMWSPAVLFGSGKTMAGMMTFQLEEQQLAMSKKFIARMNELFPNDPLPDLFLPGDAAKRSTTTRPVLVMVEYPMWPLLTLVAGLTALVVGLLFLMSALLQSKKYTVSIDGSQRTFRIKAFGSALVLNDRGTQCGALKRAFGKPVFSPEPGSPPISVRVL